MPKYYSPKVMPPNWKMIRIVSSYGTLEFKEDDNGDSCRFNIVADIPVWVPSWCAYGSESGANFGDGETPLEEIYLFLFVEMWDMVEKIQDQ